MRGLIVCVDPPLEQLIMSDWWPWCQGVCGSRVVCGGETRGDSALVHVPSTAYVVENIVPFPSLPRLGVHLSVFVVVGEDG